MNSNSNGMSTGAAVVLMILAALLIGWIISLFQPRCAVSGCDNEPTDGSRYCLLHEMSNRYYGTPDFNYINRKNKEDAKTSTEKKSTYSSGSGASGAKSSPTAKPKSSPSSKTYSGASSKKSYSSSYEDGYNDGYDDVYSDGEPDWDRYDSDDDYARGADDAMDEYEEYGEDW